MIEEDTFEKLVKSTTGIRMDELLEMSSPDIRILLEKVRAKTAAKDQVDLYWLAGFITGLLYEREKERWIQAAKKYEIFLVGPAARSQKCRICRTKIPEVN